MQDSMVATVAYALTKNEYTSFIVETAATRAETLAYDYANCLQAGNYLGANLVLRYLKDHHRNYMAANKALVALAKVAVTMGLENDIIPRNDAERREEEEMMELEKEAHYEYLMFCALAKAEDETPPDEAANDEAE